MSAHDGAGAAVTTTIELPTAADTDAFGRALGAVLRAGDLVLLAGGLGAGKTTLTKGVAVGMGIDATVTSPTFVLARMYRPATGGPRLVHVDAYRLGGRLELDDLDLDTDLTTAAVVVEWGEGVADQLAEDHLLVRLDRHPDDTRTAELVAVGGDWPRRVARAATAVRASSA
ncbi:tRNA (adenosine(37)-N6)-threonylcarbamoyltransferase complex ATPase subunit type 1 TsaE [Nakamurella leprariae]|uniref:tRNA threonylcarbamoyladenosine biosynthesis protein TsaE n=1 Tax=Nakamurella leprariae TaxID=2803911 RepID=A0A939BYY2_9ACTN|nr:tRNA (adenosine(37)-N6)-threonylcarbamoyltransferase complex ATPase subunit type 1 TsaE [Nakamurella leprariae]MBM9467575.1 tRNA (adenosine(37)-N6)-threonylcarbamoyltransferase complex ATPase subunit type 1 TsaE [Nakamurella leprariae]